MTFKQTTFIKEYQFAGFVLLASGILRWVLILRGGQFFMTDENRYKYVQEAVSLLLEGKLKTSLLSLTGELAHLGFKVTALIPALLENTLDAGPALPAIFFSFFSVGNLFLIWLVALRAGSSRQVANYGLFLAACSHVLLYYSRHLFPYDQAMFFGLLALYLALSEPNRAKHSLWCGALCFFCMVTYNGYWALAAFAMLVALVNGSKEKHWLIRRATTIGLGFFIPLALLLGGSLLIGKDFFGEYGVYVQKITQGSFNEGWRLPFEYFWHAEYGFFLMLGLLAVLTLFLLRNQRSKVAILGIGGTIFIYACLVIPSNFTQTFVVYARTARQLMPFLILAASPGLAAIHSWKPKSAWVARFLLIIMLIQSLNNYFRSYRIIYPRELIQKIQSQHPDFMISEKMMRFYAPLVCHNNGFLAINFHTLHDFSAPLYPEPGEILYRAAHPVNFRPYQYEGYTPEQRQIAREAKYEMRLYRLEDEYLANANIEIENCNQKTK